VRLSPAPAAALIVLVALGLPAGAAAKPAPPAENESPTASFAVRGTNGYRVSFVISRVLLLADARSGPYETTYVVKHPEVRGNRFTGTLPGIGAVSVRFHQRGKTKRQRTACRNTPPTLIRKGVFTGAIRLRGERAYTMVRATHARGSVTQEPGQFCTRLRPATSSRLPLPIMESPETPTLQLLAKAPHVLVQAIQVGGEGEEQAFLAVTSATHLRRHDGMMVSSGARKLTRHPSLLNLGETAFPESATVAPGQPFTGSAALALLGPKSSTWSGDLAVTLPGVGPVRLAGPTFRSTICRDTDCRGSLPFQLHTSDSEGYVGYGPKTRRSR
jgi:hypothetical protein